MAVEAHGRADQHARINKTRMLLALATLLAGAPGCGAAPPPAQAGSNGQPALEERLKPHLKRLQATRDFQPAWTPGSTRECLGRLVFEVAGPIEWALDPLDKVEHNEPPQFADGVPGDLRERMGYGRMRVMVSQPATAEAMAMHRDRHETAERGGGVEAWTRSVKKAEEALQAARERKDPELVVLRREQELEQYQGKLEIARNRRIHHFGLPDELATEEGGGELIVRSLMGGHVVSFVAGLPSEEGDPLREQTLAQLRGDIKRLRVRAPGEVPDEPGVCFPGYFLADDGTGDYQVHASFRYVDRPAITYSIDTGYRPAPDVEWGIAKPPPSNWRRVLAYPKVMLTLPEDNVQRRDLIGPTGFMAGGLSFDRTGIAITRAGEKEGDPSVRTYQLYAGMPGVQGVQVMPFIAMTMQAWPQHMYPQLKQGIPPLEESEQRFDAILRNLHLRHTTPELPDFARLLGEKKPAAPAPRGK